MARMKFIFLDVDGVLNTAPDYKMFDEKQRTDEVIVKGKSFILNVKKIELLKDIITKTGAYLIGTSSWFNERGVLAFEEMTGLPLSCNISCPPHMRQKEIDLFLDINAPDSYAIIDDSDAYTDREHFIHCIKGLTPELATKTIQLLGETK